MSLDPIGDLQNEQLVRGEIIGFRIPSATATQLGINFIQDPQFESISVGRTIAVIWNGSGFQMITFDNIDQLVWNLSNVNTREQVIDDESADLLAQHGRRFRFNLPQNNARCRECSIEFRSTVQAGFVITTRGLNVAVCPNGHTGADLIL